MPFDGIWNVRINSKLVSEVKYWSLSELEFLQNTSVALPDEIEFMLEIQKLKVFQGDCGSQVQGD